MSLRFTIYCHTSRVTGKNYVGQTRQTMADRWHEHVRYSDRRKTCTAISAAIRKYGADTFDHEILDVVTTQEGANIAERVWIEQRRTFAPNGYNLTTGGHAGTPSEESRARQSEAAKRREARMTAEEKSARVTHNSTPESRSEVARRRWASLTPEQKAARAAKASTTHRSLAKMSSIVLARWAHMTAEQRSAHSAKVHAAQTPEARSARQRKAQAGRTAEQRTASALKAWKTRRARRSKP